VTDRPEGMAMARGNNDGRPFLPGFVGGGRESGVYGDASVVHVTPAARAEYARMGQGNTMSGGTSTDCGEFPIE